MPEEVAAEVVGRAQPAELPDLLDREVGRFQQDPGPSQALGEEPLQRGRPGGRLAATPREAIEASPLIVARVLDYKALHMERAKATVRGTAAHVRAWHPWGHSDAAGFAAMGITELIVHTYDITRVLGLSWAPPDNLSSAVLARLFPDAPSGYGPSDTLLWCTGRIGLSGRARRGEWQWAGTVR